VVGLVYWGGGSANIGAAPSIVVIPKGSNLSSSFFRGVLAAVGVLKRSTRVTQLLIPLFGATALLSAPSTYAQAQAQTDEFTVSGGRGDAGIDIFGVRVGKQLGTWDWASCTTLGEADVEYWWARNHGDAPGNLTTIGALGGCRWNITSRISGELGFGVRLLGHVQIVEQKDYSTAFQFQTMGGLRYRIDDAGNYFAGVRLRHISNGAIKHPNSGINAALLSITRTF
jgi:hypothetical protein